MNTGTDEIISCRVGGQSITMMIDSGSRFNLLSEIDGKKLIDTAALLNIRSHSSNQFRAYAAKELLKIKWIFDAPISVNGVHEIIATFYVF